MTCIVAIIDQENKKVIMGADSAGTAGNNLTIRKDLKIFKNGPFLIGCSGSFRMMQLLRFSLKPPRVTKSYIFEHMCTSFIDEVREVFKTGGFLQKFEGGDDLGGFFLVAYKDRLFRVEHDFQVVETVRGYDAIGCGSNYALGAIFSCEESNPELDVLSALRAAQYFSAGVSEPFNILST